MKIGSNKDINEDHEKLPVTSPELSRAESAAPKMVKSTDKAIKNRVAAQHEQTDNRNILAKMCNNEKLAITLLIMGLGWLLIIFDRPPKRNKHNINHVETPS